MDKKIRLKSHVWAAIFNTFCLGPNGLQPKTNIRIRARTSNYINEKQWEVESESESEIVYSIDKHRIHLQIKLHNTITHTHVNRSWYMESPQCHRRSKVANPTAPSSPAAPPAVIKQLRAPPATTKAARMATAPLSGHGQVVSFTSLKLCNRLSYIFTCNVFSVDDLGTEEQRAARVPSRRHRRHRRL